MMSTDGDRGGVPAKGTLFCPACSHSGRYDGDWDREPTDRGVRLVCPFCGTEVTRRWTVPSGGRPARQLSPASVWRLWRR